MVRAMNAAKDTQTDTQSSLFWEYQCTECQNKGVIFFIAENNEVKCRPCRCIKRRRNRVRLAESGLEELVRQKSFSSYQAKEEWQKTALEMAKSYANAPKGWLVVTGEPGGGKTHLCTAVTRSLMLNQDRDLKYLVWPDECQLLMGFPANSDEANRKKKLLDTINEIEALYIDDFLKPVHDSTGAKERPRSSDISAAFKVINARYNKPGRITIISSEWHVDELINLDGALGSRIFEMSKNNIISIEGKEKNWRLK